MAGSIIPSAIISDGTTDLVFNTGVSETVDKIIGRSIKTSAGGNQKVQTSGYRIHIDAKIRMTPAQYNAFKVLMANGSLTYKYTPIQKDTHPIYAGAEIPIICTIQDDVKDFDNRSINHVNLKITSTKLFRC